jgi:hypothetical protein
VAAENKDMETQQDFVSDICSCVHARVFGIKHGWPSWGLLARCIESWNCRISVGFHDLDRTGLFRNHAGIAAYLSYYSKFEFCEPPQISKIGLIAGSEDDKSVKAIEETVERLLYKFFNGKVG